MFSKASLLALCALTASTIATPIATPEPDLTPQINLCPFTGFESCIALTLNEDCINFVGALSSVDGELDSVIIPTGWICTFFSNAACVTVSPLDTITLNSGSYSNLNAISGKVEFNDRAQSFQCALLL